MTFFLNVIKKLVYPITSFSIILLFFFSSTSHADKIKLKNGRHFSGVIKKDTATHVTIDIGGGTISLRRSSFKSIAKEIDSDPKVRSLNPINALTELSPPDPLMDVALAYKKLKLDRFAAIQARKKTLNFKKTRANLIASHGREMQRHKTIAQQVNTTDPNQNMTLYNNLVHQQNRSTNTINSIQTELNIGFKEAVSGKKVMTHYLNKLENVKSLAEASKSRQIDQDVRQQAETFWQKLDAKLSAFDEEFKRINVAHENVNGHMIVNVLINNNIEGRFLLDTGATYVTLSPELAKRLNLDLSSTLEIPLSLADNSIVDGKLVVLNSMQIGDIQANRVSAIVLDSKPNQHIDGLLGMSFLREFVISIEPSKNKLVFKRFQP